MMASSILVITSFCCVIVRIFEAGTRSSYMADVYDFNELKEGAEKIARHSIRNVLQGQAYDALRVSGWTDDITKIAVEELTRMSPNFKYAVSCIILQKLGQGVDSSST